MSHYTKEQQKAYMQKYYKERHDIIILLLGSKCANCSSTELLTVDHIDWRIKAYDVMKLLSNKHYGKLLKELKKCQLLCKPCHKEKTKQDIREMRAALPSNHGSSYMVTKKKCTCDTCIKARRFWLDKRNANQREKYGVESRGPRGPYNQPAEHGTRLRYHRGCRCNLCRRANAEAARKRNATLPQRQRETA